MPNNSCTERPRYEFQTDQLHAASLDARNTMGSDLAVLLLCFYWLQNQQADLAIPTDSRSSSNGSKSAKCIALPAHTLILSAGLSSTEQASWCEPNMSTAKSEKQCFMNGCNDTALRMTIALACRAAWSCEDKSFSQTHQCVWTSQAW